MTIRPAYSNPLDLELMRLLAPIRTRHNNRLVLVIVAGFFSLPFPSHEMKVFSYTQNRWTYVRLNSSIKSKFDIGPTSI